MTALDIIVLLAVIGSAVLGFSRGFVTEVLSLFAWVAIVAALKLFHIPLAQALTGMVGTVSGAAVLAFAILAGTTYFGGKLVARMIGERTRTSVLGPVDRALGFGFGALKGLILASLLFLVVALLVDTVGGGPARRPEWMATSRTYPLLNATSAGIADFVDRRRRGLPVFGAATAPAPSNIGDPAP
ncbi:CvpA family protein [Sphingomonas carotinifaciens]|uniref:CvpA family protein n=1 Tax=Sphingomonas carotinifaciens TaxID=1166323 RepID=A0A1G7PAP2_9SPHN|nr:CvpA family protein [Sphingomonas carotinifaciens]MBB4087372.1 membrane protein required for colicin V production [Sphingomonas carotinifaciens]MWC44603.1 CvpA family protein [Sphingomonas carotinifaciens]SDF83376.1 membrane protein required for colicin V production [Sphingomonas carotinifaciens]